MRLPGPLSGCVPARVPKLNIWLGLVGTVIAWVGLFTDNWLALSIGIGAIGALPIMLGLHWLTRWRFDRKIAHWPVHVQVMPGEDGERVAFITTHDGSVSSMILPDDYDPSDDDGEWFIRQVAPDLAEGLYDDDKEEQ